MKRNNPKDGKKWKYNDPDGFGSKQKTDRNPHVESIFPIVVATPVPEKIKYKNSERGRSDFWIYRSRPSENIRVK